MNTQFQTPSAPREQRWEQEAAFFDRFAVDTLADVQPTDPLTLKRYGRPLLRRRFNKEFRFQILGSLQRKRILDVGCGDGRNSVLLAKLGAAQVVGIDIAPAAIELAKNRARIDGVQDRVSFLCSPLEMAELSSDSFDVIWGDAILHHLIPELEMILNKLTSWAKPDALMLFAEPINLNATLRKVRKALPVHTDATPGERPLEADDITLIKRYVCNLSLRPFSLLGRLDRFVLSNHHFERSSAPRRLFASVNAYLDYALLTLPIFRNLAGQAVMYGFPRKQV
jgi:2-polyprenyl-3-methyl-5-hydroxy-6-metoxy-1,4-benzoquinol methylase